MIQCEAFNDRGLIQVSGTLPNGHLVVTRSADGVPGITLRRGELDVVQGGFSAEDNEGPLGTDLTYRATLTPNDRLIQQNLVPTPNFMHALQGWVAGATRTMDIQTDLTAHHTSVGHVNAFPGGGSVAAPPTLIGRISSADYVSGNYTLTPPTGGGTAIVTNDWMYWVHQQLGTIATPATPSGWTLVLSSIEGTELKTLVWRRKRLVGDTGYTVTVVAGAESLGTMFWFRNATDDLPVFNLRTKLADELTSVTTPTINSFNPAVVLTVVSAKMSAPGTPPVSLIGNPTWLQTQGTAANTKSVLYASQSFTDGGLSDAATISYPQTLSVLSVFQMSIQNATAVTNRIIAKAKTTAMPLAAEPYRFTARFKYTSTDVWTWAEVEAQGTWANLKATKATWEAVRSTATGTGSYARMFVAIVNPGTGAYYVPPVQVIGVTASQYGQWIDVSFYFTLTVNVPVNSEIWFMHGSAVREYLAQWYFDDIGITAGQEWLHRDGLYYMDGDTQVPADAANMYDASGNWQTDVNDAGIIWTGATGNSISRFIGPSKIWAETVCQLSPPDEVDSMPCEPVLLADPVSTALGIWGGLLGIDTLTHAGRQSVFAILGRAQPVAVSQIRNWETGSLNLLTMTLAERTQMLKVLSPGRILLLRNPDKSYPEDNWYIGIGDVGEKRVLEDHRNPMRSWDIPFVRVERPVGLIENSSGRTWAEVEAYGTWQKVRDDFDSWLDLLTAEPL